jgi:hypothetical protein
MPDKQQSDENQMSRREFGKLAVGGTSALVVGHYFMRRNADEQELDDRVSQYKDLIAEPSKEEIEIFEKNAYAEMVERTGENFETTFEPWELNGYTYTKVSTQSENGYWSEGLLIHIGKQADLAKCNDIVINLHSIDGAAEDLESLYANYKRVIDSGTRLFIPLTKGLNNLRTTVPDFSTDTYTEQEKIVELKYSRYMDNSPYDVLQNISGTFKTGNFSPDATIDMVGVSHGGSVGMTVLELWNLFEKRSGKSLPKLHKASLYAPVNDMLSEPVLRSYLEPGNNSARLGTIISRIVAVSAEDAMIYPQNPDIKKLAKVEPEKVADLRENASRKLYPKWKAYTDQNVISPNLDILRETPGGPVLFREALYRFSPGNTLDLVKKLGEHISDTDIQVLYATMDAVVPPEQTIKLFQHLRSQGNKNVHIHSELGGHVYNTFIINIIDKLRALETPKPSFLARRLARRMR